MLHSTSKALATSSEPGVPKQRGGLTRDPASRLKAEKKRSHFQRSKEQGKCSTQQLEPARQSSKDSHATVAGQYHEIDDTSIKNCQVEARGSRGGSG